LVTDTLDVPLQTPKYIVDGEEAFGHVFGRVPTRALLQ
jgi:hypothetical protein